MPKYLISVLSLLIFSSEAVAQNEAEATLFTGNYTSFNPAMSGLIYNKEANVLWRNQWTAVSGAPATLWANYNQKLNKIHGGVGFNYFYDVIGNQKMHSTLLNYAYHVQLKKMVLSLGASAGMKSLEMTLPAYYVAPNTLNDPFIPTAVHFKPVFDAQAGLAINFRNLNVGFSVTQLNGAMFRNSSTNIAYKLTPTFHLHADYSISLNAQWKITPAMHVFTDWVKFASTSSVKVTYANKLWFGINSWNLIASKKSGKSVGPMIGYNFKEKYRIGYSLEFYPDFYVQMKKTNLTHEIILSFLLK